MYPFISPGYTACPFTPTLYTFLLYFPVGFLLSFTRFYSISILRGKVTTEVTTEATAHSISILTDKATDHSISILTDKDTDPA